MVGKNTLKIRHLLQLGHILGERSVDYWELSMERWQDHELAHDTLVVTKISGAEHQYGVNLHEGYTHRKLMPAKTVMACCREAPLKPNQGLPAIFAQKLDIEVL